MQDKLAALHDYTLVGINGTGHPPRILSLGIRLTFENPAWDRLLDLEITIPGLTLVFGAGVCIPSIITTAFLVQPFKADDVVHAYSNRRTRLILEELGDYPQIGWALVFEGDSIIVIAGLGPWDEQMVAFSERPA